MAKKLRILILEDVPTDAQLMEEELRRRNVAFTSKVVATRRAFVAALRDFAPDVILSDYMLPQFNGMKALSLAKELSPDEPFIIVTGSINEQTAVECIKAGAADYVTKDHLGRLVPAVQGALEKKREREERERAERALERSEERFRKLFEESNDAIFIHTLDGRILDVNSRACQMIGYSAEQLRTMRIQSLHAEDAQQASSTALEETDESRSARFECGFKRADGTRIDVEVSARLVDKEEGLVQAIVRDITERKTLEEQLWQSQKLEAIGRLAGGVAHDLNNLLVVMGGYAQMVLDALDPDSPLRKDTEHVIAASKRAADLTRQLLAFARRQPLAPIVLNINDLVENTSNMLQRIIGEHIALEFFPAPDLGNVRADVGQIEQVLMNLAVNARDAMRNGGRLTIKTANATLDEDYARAYVSVQPGPHVMLSVSDTGCGMDQEVQRKIFEPFFTTKAVGKGTGLGLATVYGVVKQHGGSIWVYSEPGKGTTFKVYLPRVDAEAEALRAATPALHSAGGTETILLVEDEESVRQLAERVLRQRGYDVLAAAGAGEAEDLFAQRADDIGLVLTDVVMPGRSGLVLYRRLAAYRPSLKVLYVSGYSETAFVPEEVFRSGSGFLQKPFTADELARKVREVLDAPEGLQGTAEAVPHGAKRS